MTHPTRKLGPKHYRPFKVLKVVRHVNFHLELPAHWKIHNIFHAKLLHPYKETEEHGENFTEPPPDLIEGEPEWEVEKILDIRMQWSQDQYLIRWKGYLSAHNSWEPWENIKASLLMAEFKKQRSTQEKEDTQEQPKVQKRGRTGAIRVICLETSLLTQSKMCNRTPPTPACSITLESPFVLSPPMLRADFVYRADRLIPCVQLTYAVLSTSPWRGLSALELLIRSQLRLRVYSVIELPRFFKAKLTRYCS